jgi:SSS family solute:Na+ symporter
MELHLFDILFFLGFITVVVVFAMAKSRRERTSEDYFLAGRGLTWPLIGLSIVAANISTEQMVGMAGQGAGEVGLAVSAWQLAGSIGIVVIAFTFLPRFLKAGIYTMPEFLEYRYNSVARAIMALMTVVIYVAVLLVAVLYSGGLTLSTIFDQELTLTQSVWIVGLIAAFYTAWGGLKAVAYADLLLGAGLLLGGLLTFGLGLDAVGGWSNFLDHSGERLHMVLPADHPKLPWTGVVSGLWIVIIYYCGLNQFIVQRNLAAKTLHHGQMGLVFAGALWLLVPFAIVMPGIISRQLYPTALADNPDQAFPLLIRNLIPIGLRGVVFAAIAGAVISSLASMLNSASTIFTIDVYKRLFAPGASERRLVILGRAMTLLFVAVGCLVAPMLSDPRFGGVFQYIQQYQGYIWPGVVAAFVVAFVLPRAPAMAGVAALVGGPIIYGLFQTLSGWHFLTQVLLTFIALIIASLVITLVAPLSQPRTLPVREDMALRNSRPALLVGTGVILGVIVFTFIFW